MALKGEDLKQLTVVLIEFSSRAPGEGFSQTPGWDQ